MRRSCTLIFSIVLLFFSAINCSASGIPSRYVEFTLKKDTTTSSGKNDTSKKAPKADEFVLKPVIGLGTGMLSYYGNVKDIKGPLQNPMTSRIGYDLMFAQKLTPVIEFELYALFGKLSVNERTTTLNWNFLSEVRGGGMHLMFKILPKQNVIPYVITGVESFEYLTKTDLYDNQGNPYYYWSDGTIRNTSPTAPNASTATVIYRDYTYESDMRSLNIGNSGKYNMQTFAIPIGIGFMFHLNKKADFLIGTTLHYTFTNHIDGIGDSSIGTKKHDMFMMSSIALRFDLSRRHKGEDTNEGYLPESLEDVDFAALMNDDYDKDGVRDWDDSCAGTPKGVAVDSKGCPIDGDKDGIPDYRDLEPNTPYGKVVDEHGVALTDSMILRQYQIYTDSTGQFAQIVEENKIGNAVKKAPVEQATRYTIQLGRFSKGIPPDVMDKLLSIPDVKSSMMPDSSTVYTVGDYSDYTAAQNKQQQFTQNGLTDAKVVYKKGNEFVIANGPVQNNNPVNNNPTNNPNTNPNNNNPVNNNPTNNPNTNPNNNNPVNNNPNTNPNNNNPTNTPPSTGTIVYRIQLGAYSHKLSRDVFGNIDNLVEVKTENGFYTYSAGSFTNYQDAVNYKTRLVTEGYNDIFIKAYQNGKRISLDKGGATYVKPTKEDLNESVNQESSTLDKTQIRFRIQVGIFKDNPPADMAARFSHMSDLEKVKDSNGLTHYVVGSYTNYNDAKAMRAKLAAEPLLKGAFVVAYYKNEPIPVSQALSILKQ